MQWETRERQRRPEAHPFREIRPLPGTPHEDLLTGDLSCCRSTPDQHDQFWQLPSGAFPHAWRSRWPDPIPFPAMCVRGTRGTCPAWDETHTGFAADHGKPCLASLTRVEAYAAYRKWMTPGFRETPCTVPQVRARRGDRARWSSWRYPYCASEGSANSRYENE